MDTDHDAMHGICYDHYEDFCIFDGQRPQIFHVAGFVCQDKPHSQEIMINAKDHTAMTTNHISKDQTSWRLSKSNLPKTNT